MSYQATNLRNAFVAVSLSLLVSVVMLANTISVPMA